MPKLSDTLPKYRKHKASGQAIVTIMGRDVYLGPFGTKASKSEYDRLIGEWLAAGRPSCPPKQPDLAVVELATAYKKFARSYYRKNGASTGTAETIELTLKTLCTFYGRLAARDFGPLALQAMQQRFVEMGHSRRYVNDNIDRIRRMFRWGVANEMVDPGVSQALAAVPGLRKGRTKAREAQPIRPVEDAVVEATVPYMPPVVVDMTQFQRLTGSRPAEVCIIRPCDVDRSADVWLFTPESHKTEHLGRERVICIGPKAQAVLRPYLLRADTHYCFRPADSEKARRAERHAKRRVPIHYGNRPGKNCKRQPKRSPGDRYSTASYRRAIHRAVDAANRAREKEAAESGAEAELLPRWSPNQLRHSTGTAIRKQFGLEASRVTLGHSEVETTQIYAERDIELAAKIMREVG